jgi:hypothetical protein
MSVKTEVAGRSSPVDSGLYVHQEGDLQPFDNFPFPVPEDVSTGHDGLAQQLNVPMTTGPSFSMFTATADDNFASMANRHSLASNVTAPQESVVFDSNTIIDSPPNMWSDAVTFLESQRSSPALFEDWIHPTAHTTNSASNSPLNYSPSLDGLSPRYVPEFPDLVEFPPYTTGDRVVKKPVGPRLSKVVSDLANREQRATGTSEASDESQRLVGRSSLEIDNTARDHHLYHNVSTKSDGLYHCPWEGKEGCQHKPEKLKCNYEYDPF